MLNRRTFLGDLATLPLIGGSVALLGRPTAAAVPVTDRLLATYDEWLDLERSHLLLERHGESQFTDKFWGDRPVFGWFDRRTGESWTSHSVRSFAGFDHRRPSTRAAVILSAAGVPLT